MKRHVFIVINHDKWRKIKKNKRISVRKCLKKLPKPDVACYTLNVNCYCYQKGVLYMARVYDVANWFLSKEKMTHKKLQKLCYYAQAWSYALKDKPLIDAEFQAWVHGPVCPQLYEQYKGSGMMDLTADPRSHFDFSSNEEELLESVWETYGSLTGNALEVLTHSEPPWRNARAGCAENQICQNVISSEDMKRYYKSIYIGDTESDA